MKEKIKFNFKAEGLDENAIDEILQWPWENWAASFYWECPECEAKSKRDHVKKRKVGPYDYIIRNLSALIKNTNLPDEYRARYEQDRAHFMKLRELDRERRQKPTRTRFAWEQEEIFYLCMYVAKARKGRYWTRSDVFQMVSRIWEFKRGKQIPMEKIREFFWNESFRQNKERPPSFEI